MFNHMFNPTSKLSLVFIASGLSKGKKCRTYPGLTWLARSKSKFHVIPVSAFDTVTCFFLIIVGFGSVELSTL